MAVAGAILALLAAGSAPDCAALAGRSMGGAEVLSAAADSLRREIPPFCRVALESRSAAGSRIGTDVWLPLRGWTGRFVQLGTGGFAGTLPEAGMAAEVARGNAVAVTDTGHKGADGFDARWALNAPAAVTDYAHRSLKVSATGAKATVAAFYGAAARYSYFVGCSNGGRQALMAAQRYPEDWDGVLAGAPAVRWTEQLASFARIQHALRSRPDAMIPAASLATVQRGGSLPAPQQAALELIARDFDPRWATVPGGWDRWIVNPDRKAPSQLTLAEQFFSYVVLGRPGWRVEALTSQNLARARALAPLLDVRPDLSGFARRGGKLLMYAGAADPVISPKSAADFYRRLGRQDFARLYIVPGMLHCQGGQAPDAFGQSAVSPPLKPDPEHDIRLSLEAWVELGREPSAITAVKYVADDPARGVAATARICPEATRAGAARCGGQASARP